MSKLPRELIDAHHHFLDTTKDGSGNDFQAFLGSLVKDEQYVASHYYNDVVQPLQEKGIKFVGSVHVECMPDDGAKEIMWVDSIARQDCNCTVKAIVGSCDLVSPSVDEDLAKLKRASPMVRGVRWILDCVGPFEPGTATHVATTRHDGYDYLRGSNGRGTYDGHVVPEFERGFACLSKHGLSFDLQCAPVQLMQAAELFRKYPNVPVVIDHLGKPRTLLGPDEDHNINNTTPNSQEIEEWRKGMKAMASLPHVYVKLSMLGYAVPGWKKTPQRIVLVRDLVREIVELFTPRRCMVALNWWKNGAVSDSDFLSNVGPSPVELVQYMISFFEGYTDEDKERLFCGTAKEFYRIG